MQQMIFYDFPCEEFDNPWNEDDTEAE